MGKRVHENLEIRGVVYATAQEAAAVLGVQDQTVMIAARTGRLDGVGLAPPSRPPEVVIRGVGYPSPRAAAEALGVSVNTVYAARSIGKLDSVGTELVTPLSKITREDLAPIWARKDIPLSKMAEVLGVTPQALSYKARSLGLPPRSKIMSDARFRALWLAGVRTAEIAAEAGYCGCEPVIKRRCRMGLPSRGRGRSHLISIEEYREAELSRLMQDARENECS